LYEEGPSGKAKVSKRGPYMAPTVERREGGRMCRAILSRQSPSAMSDVLARVTWVVDEVECRRSVCPPDTRSVRKGKVGESGVVGVEVGERADTSRGVSACACIWWIPSRGTCHAVARPLAVSRPVERLERIPGPRVTEMKSGFLLVVNPTD